MLSDYLRGSGRVIIQLRFSADLELLSFVALGTIFEVVVT